MKKTILFTTIFLSMAFLISIIPSPQKAYAATLRQNGISVIGQAEIKTKADTAKICFGVEKLEETLSQSEESVRQEITSIKNKLNNLNFEVNTPTTESFYAYKKYSYHEGKETLLGYQTHASLSVIVSDLENIQQIISTISQNANSINNIKLYKKDTAELYNQALNKALENAKEKANTLSGGKSISIQSLSEEVFYQNYFYASAKRQSQKGNDFEGEITISAKVKVVFGFDNQTNKNTATLYNKNLENMATNKTNTHQKANTPLNSTLSSELNQTEQEKNSNQSDTFNNIIHFEPPKQNHEEIFEDTSQSNIQINTLQPQHQNQSEIHKNTQEPKKEAEEEINKETNNKSDFEIKTETQEEVKQKINKFQKEPLLAHSEKQNLVANFEITESADYSKINSYQTTLSENNDTKVKEKKQNASEQSKEKSNSEPNIIFNTPFRPVSI